MAPLRAAPPLRAARIAMRALSASLSRPCTTFALGAAALASLGAGVCGAFVGAGAVSAAVAVDDGSGGVSGVGGGTVLCTISSRPALRSSLTTGSIQSLYIAPTSPKWTRKLKAAIMVRFQSIWLAMPPLTESGSWGLG